MQVEILVLGRNECLFDQCRNIFGRNEQTAFTGEFVHQTAFAGIDAADRGGGVLGKLFIVGQIAPVHPKYAADRNGDRDDTKSHRRKDAADSRQQEHADALRGIGPPPAHRPHRAYDLHGRPWTIRA